MKEPRTNGVRSKMSWIIEGLGYSKVLDYPWSRTSDNLSREVQTIFIFVVLSANQMIMTESVVNVQ